MMILVLMVLLVADGMVHIIASRTRKGGNVTFAVIWMKPLLSHLTTMVENLQSTEEISIYQLHKKRNSLGLCICVMIQFVSSYMLGQLQMYVADGVQPSQLVRAGTNQTQVYINILWMDVQHIRRLEMLNI